ncbi:MAG: hypothetical protein LBT38_04215, partial [Deltaproteobacteria bacterium]|nr:hypothetical protein [Deltaproteobacteria bacterium]
MNNAYRPSGYFDSKGILLVPLGTAIFSMFLAIPYALSLWYCPIVYLGLFLPLIFAKLTALSGRWTIRQSKIRSPQLANMLGAVGAIPGFYFSWVAWGVLVSNISGQGTLNIGWRSVITLESSVTLGQLFSQALDPLGLLKQMKFIGPMGLWSVEKAVVSGIYLYGVWAFEALIFFIVSSRSYGQWAKPPFAERLNRWYPSFKLSTPIALPGKIPTDSIFEGIKKGQIGPIIEAKEEKNPDGASYLTTTLYYLPQAFDAYISVEGYSLKDSGGHKKTKLAKYIKIPE